MDSGVGVGPDIVEYVECVDVYYSFNREFTEKEVQSWDRAGLAQLEKASLYFVMEYSKRFYVQRSFRKGVDA